MDELEVEKAQVNQTRQQEEERHRNSEQPAQTHSPPNHQTQVQPRNGEVIGNTENRPVNGRQDGKTNEGGRQDSPLVVKRVSGGTIDHCSTSKAIHPNPHHDPGSEKSQLHPAPQQHQHQQEQPSSTNSLADNGAKSHPGGTGQSHLKWVGSQDPCRCSCRHGIS